MKIDEIIALFPTEDEVNKETESSRNSPMASIAESVFYPDGFADGVRWTIEKIKENMRKKDDATG